MEQYERERRDTATLQYLAAIHVQATREVDCKHKVIWDGCISHCVIKYVLGHSYMNYPNHLCDPDGCPVLDHPSRVTEILNPNSETEMRLDWCWLMHDMPEKMSDNHFPEAKRDAITKLRR